MTCEGRADDLESRVFPVPRKTVRSCRETVRQVSLLLRCLPSTSLSLPPPAREVRTQQSWVRLIRTVLLLSSPGPVRGQSAR